MWENEDSTYRELPLLCSILLKGCKALYNNKSLFYKYFFCIAIARFNNIDSFLDSFHPFSI